MPATISPVERQVGAPGSKQRGLLRRESGEMGQLGEGDGEGYREQQAAGGAEHGRDALGAEPVAAGAPRRPEDAQAAVELWAELGGGRAPVGRVTILKG